VKSKLLVFRKYSLEISSFIFFSFFISLFAPIYTINAEVATLESAAVSNFIQHLNANSPYTETARLYLPSLTKQKLAEASEKAQAATNKELQLPNIKPTEKIELLYSLLAQSDKSTKSIYNEINQNVFSDLELLCSSDLQESDHHLFGTIDRTKTTIGKIQLQKILITPLNDIAQLKERQRIIKLLVENPELFNKIEEYLENLKKVEDDFLWMWKQTNDEIKMFFNSVYFNNYFKIPFEKLNTNELALDAYGKNILFLIPVAMILTTLTTRALQGRADQLFNEIQTREIDKKCCTQDDVNNAIINVTNVSSHKDETQSYLGYVFYGQFVNAFANWGKIPKLRHSWQELDKKENGELGRLFDGSNNYKYTPEEDAKTRWMIGLATAWYTLIPITMLSTIGYTAYYCYKSAKEYNTVSNLIHGKMLNIASFINNLKALGCFLDKQKDLGDLLPHENLKTIEKENDTMQQALALISSNSFKKQPSYFAFKGRVLALFRLLYELKYSFVTSLKEVGDIDAIMSISKLYKEHAKNTNGCYCFAEYENTPRPAINIEGFWHPYLNPEKAVLNNFATGYPTTSYYTIITGPNGGGKSTILKALTLAIWYGQTLTICPAERASFTPFKRFNTYLNMVDHIGKESLFQAEVRRASELLKMLKQQIHDDFSFVIMDEIFTGTNAYEGEIGAYGVAKHFLNFSNVIGLFATHFPQITTLENNTDGIFKNYMVSVEVQYDGTIRPHYKLEPGIATQHIALQMLLNNKSFDKEILQNAIDTLST
jgi:ABC-type multidrug transport system fused ATPase/permease subunit